VATDPLLYFSSLLSDRVMCLLLNSSTYLCTLNCTWAQVKVHSSIFLLSKWKFH